MPEARSGKVSAWRSSDEEYNCPHRKREAEGHEAVHVIAEGVPDVGRHASIVGYTMKTGLVVPMLANFAGKCFVLFDVEGKGEVRNHLFFLQDVEGSKKGGADAVK